MDTKYILSPFSFINAYELFLHQLILKFSEISLTAYVISVPHVDTPAWSSSCSCHRSWTAPSLPSVDLAFATADVSAYISPASPSVSAACRPAPM